DVVLLEGATDRAGQEGGATGGEEPLQPLERGQRAHPPFASVVGERDEESREPGEYRELERGLRQHRHTPSCVLQPTSVIGRKRPLHSPATLTITTDAA